MEQESSGHDYRGGSTRVNAVRAKIPPNAVRLIVTAVALLGLAVMVWRVSDLLVVAFGGIVMAAFIRGLADPLARRTGLRDRCSVLIVVAAFLLLMVAVGWLFGQQATEQATDLKRQLPVAFQKAVAAIEHTSVGNAVLSGLRDSTSSSKLLSNVGIAATALVSGVLDLVLILFLSIYFALDVGLYRNGALRLLPPRYREHVGRVLDDAGEALQRWLIGQAIAMITVGVLVGVGLALVGVPLPFALGVLAALLEFVPVLGPVLFSIPGLLLAFAKGPHTALYALFVYLVVQQSESNVLIPLLQRWAVELPPVVGLLAVVAGGLLLGIPGVVFATPLAVVVMRLVKHLYVEDALERNAAPAVRVLR